LPVKCRSGPSRKNGNSPIIFSPTPGRLQTWKKKYNDFWTGILYLLKCCHNGF